MFLMDVFCPRFLFVPACFRLLPLPDEILWQMWIRQICERFVMGLRVRRRAAHRIQVAWDLHLMMSLPDLVPMYVPVHNPWIVPYIHGHVHGPWLHENMFDEIEEVD